MSEQRIDLDALSKELRKEGWSGNINQIGDHDWYEAVMWFEGNGRPKFRYKLHLTSNGMVMVSTYLDSAVIGSLVLQDGTSIDNDPFKTALDIIRRHVAPAPAAPDADASGFTKEELWLISEALYEHSEFVADDPDEHGLTGSDYKQLSHKAYLIGGGIPPFPRFSPDQEVAPDAKPCEECGGAGKLVFLTHEERCERCNPAAPDAGLRDSDAVILQVAKTLYNTFDDPYERDQAFDDLPDRTRHFYVDTAREIAAILALLPPRIDGVTIPRELAERAAAALEMTAREPINLCSDVNQPRADAAELRALLGREGV